MVSPAITMSPGLTRTSMTKPGIGAIIAVLSEAALPGLSK